MCFCADCPHRHQHALVWLQSVNKPLSGHLWHVSIECRCGTESSGCLQSDGPLNKLLVCHLTFLSLHYTYVLHRMVQRCLQSLTLSACADAVEFVHNSDRLFSIVYDNINFTLHKAGQHIDNTTEQLNTTTLAVIALPSKFSRSLYSKFLLHHSCKPGLHKDMMKKDLWLTPAKQVHMVSAFEFQVHQILLQHAPGLQKLSRRHKRLIKKTRENQPQLRMLGTEKTNCFPLPALDEEEASVGGTIRVVTKLFTDLL